MPECVRVNPEYELRTLRYEWKAVVLIGLCAAFLLFTLFRPAAPGDDPAPRTALVQGLEDLRAGAERMKARLSP